MLMFPTMTGGLGGGAPTVLEQIDAMPGRLDVWTAADSAKYQSHDTSTPALSADDPVDRIDGLLGNYNLYADGTTTRPLLKAASGVSSLEFNGSSNYLTSDTSATYSSGFLMAGALSGTFTRISAFRIITGLGNLRYVFSSAVVNRGALFTNGPNTAVTMYSGGSFDTQAPLAPGVDVVITEVFNGASSLIRKDGVQVDTGSPGTADPDGFTVGASRNASIFSAYTNIRLMGTALFDGVLSTENIEIGEGYLGT